jgi:recombinase/recombinase-like zinc beta ribbon protein
MWRDSCSMSETVGAGAASGFAALVGRLRLRIVSGDGYFEVEGPEGEELHPHSVEVEAPAATVGCGGDADWRLAGSSTRGMSRRHLLLQPAGRQWTVLDCSKNGTWELVPERAPELLPPNFPVPVTPGMRLRLGVGLELKLEPVQDLPPGRAPLGYLNKRKWDGANDIRYVEVDEERSPLVQWAFSAYSTGDWSLKSLADELYRRGLRSRPTPKRPAGKVPVSALHQMLRNPYYVGIIEFRGVRYEGTHPTFISQELFDNVQRVLTSQQMAGDRARKHQGHYLVGTVYCGLCGKRLMYTKCTGRHGRKFEYLVCSGRHKEKACGLPYMPVEKAERFVTAHYETRVPVDAERVAALEPSLTEQFRRVLGSRQKEVERVRRRVDEIRGHKPGRV